MDGNNMAKFILGLCLSLGFAYAEAPSPGSIFDKTLAQLQTAEWFGKPSHVGFMEVKGRKYTVVRFPSPHGPWETLWLEDVWVSMEMPLDPNYPDPSTKNLVQFQRAMGRIRQGYPRATLIHKRHPETGVVTWTHLEHTVAVLSGNSLTLFNIPEIRR